MIQVLIVLMWIFVILLVFILIGDEIKSILSKIKIAKIGDIEFKLIDDILNPYEHNFFYNIKRYIKYEDKYPQCDDKVKTEIIKNMLRIKLKTWYNKYLDFFSSNQSINSSNMNSIIEDIINEYNNEWEKARIPQYIIDSFNKKHNNKIGYMSTEMKYLFTNHSSETDDKFFIYIFLNRSLILLDETFEDMEYTLKKIELKEEDKKYNDIVEKFLP